MKIKNQPGESMDEVGSNHKYLSNVRRFFCKSKYFYLLSKPANQVFCFRLGCLFLFDFVVLGDLSCATELS